MPVFRVEKNENYTPISNIPVRDMTLSLRAKGLLTVVLSLPDEWEFSIKGLASICREGRDGISSALNELQRNGYLKRKQSRQPNGTMGSVEYFSMKARSCVRKNRFRPCWNRLRRERQRLNRIQWHRNPACRIRYPPPN